MHILNQNFNRIFYVLFCEFFIINMPIKIKFKHHSIRYHFCNSTDEQIQLIEISVK